MLRRRRVSTTPIIKLGSARRPSIGSGNVLAKSSKGLYRVGLSSKECSPFKWLLNIYIPKPKSQTPQAKQDCLLNRKNAAYHTQYSRKNTKEYMRLPEQISEMLDKDRVEMVPIKSYSCHALYMYIQLQKSIVFCN